MIDPAVTLALVVDLYAQVRALTEDVKQLETALTKVQPKDEGGGPDGDHH